MRSWIQNLPSGARPFLNFALLVSLLTAGAPGVAADFAHNYGGTQGGLVTTNGVATDNSGNQFVTGTFNGSKLTLGNVTLNKIGSYDAFVAKLDTAGSVIWARNFGGNGAASAGNGIAVDHLGNAFVVGSFRNAGLTIPALTPIGYNDTFVISLDSNGTLLWARNFGGTGISADGVAIAVDNLGSIFAAGQFRGNLTIPALAKIGQSDTFVIKLDVNTGTVNWATNVGGTSAYAYGQSIATDTAGNAYVSGYFDSGSLTSPPLEKMGDSDVFVVKLSGSGLVGWARNFGGNAVLMQGGSVAIDSLGHILLGGYFSGANPTAPALTKIGTQDAFAIALDTNGAITWGRNFGGTGVQVQVVSIAVDSHDNAVLGGKFFGGNLLTPPLAQVGPVPGLVLKLDPSGSPVWALALGGGDGSAMGSAVGVDGSDNVHVGGYFLGALTTPSLPYHGVTDAYTLKISAAGNIAWARNFWTESPGGSAVILATKFDTGGATYICGYFTGTTFTLGNSTLDKIGMQDAFVAKLDVLGNIVWARNAGGQLGDAECQGLAVDGAGNVYIDGNFSAVDLGFPPVARIGVRDAFAMKFDAAGADVWVTNFGGIGTEAVAYGMAVDSDGNAYVSGYYRNGSLTTPPLSSIGYQDAFVIKLDAASGAQLWARNFGGSSAGVVVKAIATGSAGEIYLTGSYGGGGLTTPILPSLGNEDGLAIKLDPNGQLLWSRTIGGSGAYAEGESIAVDSVGNVLLGGIFAVADLSLPPLSRIGDQDVFAIKLDPNGTNVWARNFGGFGSRARATGIAAGDVDSVYLGGWLDDAGLTTPALGRIGIQDALAIKLHSDGTTMWAKNFGGSGAYAQFQGIAADSAGRLYAAGDMGAANLSVPPLTIIGNIDALVIKGAYHAVTYLGNGDSGGIVPVNTNAYAVGEAVTVAKNGTMVKTGSGFAGWNTAADGSGVHYDAGQAATMPPADLVLYAQWVVGGPAVLQGASSRKAHGLAGAFDLPI